MFLTPLEIINDKNQSLDSYWINGPKAHRGVTIPDFCNFFMLYGPNTNLGHNSIVFMIECQVKYVVRCIEKVIKSGNRTIVPKHESMNIYNIQLQKGLEKTVFSEDCSSWYKNDSGKILNNYHKGHVEYFFENTFPKFHEYDFS